MTYTQAFIFAIILAPVFFFLGTFNPAKTTPPVNVTVQERTDVLLKTCFPAPDFKYKNAAPLCESFKDYVIKTADEAESTVKP